ncbi:hypothetical protein TrVE_jg6337 [Triparma verrucosa]|uniref:Ubiquitin carboxyl-terminal hydrolase n=1 Tax=Triparma verrucosa TaxID=1606542 RepID=A0A9W7BVC0_9STRA|nr:hypothetical protein TrVE_jg6337 [Triparma verrucosa]
MEVDRPALDDTDIDTIFSKKTKPKLKPNSPPVPNPNPPKSPPPIARIKSPAPAPLSPRSITRQTSSQALSDPVGNRPRLNSTDSELLLPRKGLCEEQPVLSSYKWLPDFPSKLLPPSASSKKSIGPGLRNLGNTCFLNSTLQCLCYSPVFSQCLLLPPPTSSAKPPSRITLILRNLLKTMHCSPSNKTTSAVNPSPLVSRLRELSKNFKPHRQEDAHEFLITLLSHLQDSELLLAGIDSRKSGWRDRLGLKRLDETSLVHRMFGGYLRSQILCTKCGFKSNTYDPFLDLALDISSKPVTSLKSALKHHTSSETLDADNKYSCSSCSSLVCARKQLTIFRPPLTLIIQLKRFRYSPFGPSRSSSKISKKVNYAKKLELPLSDKRVCVYNLTSVLVHVGTSSSSGHYYSYVKGISGKWFEMNDEFVRPVREEEVMGVREAYLLFYTREEVKLDLPGLPNRVGEVERVEGGMTGEEAREKVKEKKGRERRMSDAVEEEARKEEEEDKKEKEMEIRKESQKEGEKKEATDGDGSVTSYAHGIAVKVKRYKFDKVRVAPAFTGCLGRFIPFGQKPMAARNGFQIHSLCKVGEEDVDGEEEGSGNKTEVASLEAEEDTSDYASDSSSSAPSSSSSSEEEDEEESSTPPTLPKSKVKSKPKLKSKGSKALLGNVAVGGWSDSDSDSDISDHQVSTSIKKVRAAQLAAEEASALNRKRKLRKSNWDEKLDEGKRKKVKGKKVEGATFEKVGKENPFFKKQSQNMRLGGGKKGGSGKDFDRRKR